MPRQGSRFDEQRRFARGHSVIVSGRRFALALALAGLVAGCLARVAAADNAGQQVTAIIFPKSGQPWSESESVSVGKLGQSCPAYTGQPIALYRQDGTTTQSLVNATTWSLVTVLGCLTDPPVLISDVVKVLVEQGNAPELRANSPLGPFDLTYPNPSDFLRSSETPLIASNGTSIIYDRPQRTQGDANAQDEVVASGTDFRFEVFERTLLGVTVVPSANSPVAVGSTVSFSVQAPGMGPVASYSWDFGGVVPNSTVPNPSVTYSNAGAYHVTVQVTDTAGNVAQSQPLLIQVGSTTPTTFSTPTTPTTPTNSNGSTPHRPPGNRTTPKPGSSGNGGSGGNGTSRQTAATPITTSGTAGTPNGSGQSGSGSSSAGGTTATRGGARGQARHPTGHAVTPAKGRPTSTTGPARIVTGRLISDVRLLPAGASPLVHAVGGRFATAPGSRRPVAAAVLPLAAASAILLLFTLGAGRELRWRRNLRGLFGS